MTNMNNGSGGGRASSRRIAVLIKVVIGAIIVGNVVFYFPLIRLWVEVVTSNTTCSFRQVMDGLHYLESRDELARRATALVRMTEDQKTGHDVWDTQHGRFWAPRRSRPSVPMLLAESGVGLYRTERDGQVKAGDIVMDCGANIGTFTRSALQRGARKVIAIEPAPDVVACLRETFSTEISDGRVVVVPKGVWDKRDALILQQSGDSVGDSFVIQSAERKPTSVAIELLTIDELVTELKLPSVDYIKMDIEGAERRALAGAKQTILRFRPRMAIAGEHLADDPVVLPALIKSFRTDYTLRCGPCYRMWYHRGIAPDVMYFF